MNFSIPIIQHATQHLQNTAIIDQYGEYTYEVLLHEAQQVASLLLANQTDLKEARVAFLIHSSFDYVRVQWGTWLAGGIAVPLCPSHPPRELEYVLDNSEADILVVGKGFEETIKVMQLKEELNIIDIDEFQNISLKTLPTIEAQRRGMILYTSGTTSAPKGVVSTHENISFQINCLVDYWGWQSNDYILNPMPLHHTHGIINVLCSALWIGATCEMLPKFDADTIWDKLISGPSTLYMGVPTTYVKLIQAWEKASDDQKQAMTDACQSLRLMVSGSAALPVSVFEKWKSITSHSCLERYGMTELGMALSNPLNGERRPGHVGHPLPGVSIRLVDDQGKVITEEKVPGEIQVKGKNVFLEYWKKPEATKESFKDGWFLTGDVATLENNYYRILGRTSVDIIKSGGYKISALEIESVLLHHPAISECSVIGIADEEWGEKVTAVLVLKEGHSLSIEELREWGKDHLAKYKLPSQLKIVSELPRNVMGKVMKPKVKELFSL